jgi:hypothetical protein
MSGNVASNRFRSSSTSVAGASISIGFGEVTAVFPRTTGEESSANIEALFGSSTLVSSVASAVAEGCSPEEGAKASSTPLLGPGDYLTPFVSFGALDGPPPLDANASNSFFLEVANDWNLSPSTPPMVAIPVRTCRSGVTAAPSPTGSVPFVGRPRRMGAIWFAMPPRPGTEAVGAGPGASERMEDVGGAGEEGKEGGLASEPKGERADERDATG